MNMTLNKLPTVEFFLNSKLETRNPKQFSKLKIQMYKKAV
jgi:hypothetical protein